jgi:hypothetical protein
VPRSRKCGTSPEDNPYWAFTAFVSYLGAQEGSLRPTSSVGSPKGIGTIGSPLVLLGGSEPTDLSDGLWLITNPDCRGLEELESHGSE